MSDSKGQYDTETQLAIESYQKAISINPKDAWYHSTLGFAYYKRGKYDWSTKFFQKSIAINPNNADAHGLLGLIYKNQGEYDLAIEFYQKAITINPEDARYHYSLACVYSLYDKTNLSIESLRKVISLDSYLIGKAEKDSDFDNIREEFKALIRSIKIEFFQKAIAIDPENARSHYKLARVYSLYDKKALSIESLRKSISLDKHLIRKAKGERDFNNIREEFKAFVVPEFEYNEAIAKDPSKGREMHYRLGLIYYDLDKCDLAIESFQKVIAIDPEYASAYSWLGAAYSKQGKYDLAIESYQKSIRICPYYESAWYRCQLARAYFLYDKTNLSIESLRKAISLDKDIIGKVEKDSDFDNICQSPEFKAFIKEPIMSRPISGEVYNTW